MKNERTAKNKIIAAVIFAVLILGVIVFIFANSLKTGTESADDSEVITVFIKGLLGKLGITADKDTVTLIVRKCAHFSEYFLLSAIIFSAFYYFTKNKYLPFLSTGICFIVALTDEFVFQRMTYGRGPLFTDVLIDTGGAAAAGVLLFLIIFIKERSHKKKEKQ